MDSADSARVDAISAMREHKNATNSPLAAFRTLLREFCTEGKYRVMAEATQRFVAVHPQDAFFVMEAVPVIVGDHVVTKLNAASAFKAYTLRHPNWTTTIRGLITRPDEFEAFARSIETEVSAGTRAA